MSIFNSIASKLGFGSAEAAEAPEAPEAAPDTVAAEESENIEQSAVPSPVARANC